MCCVLDLASALRGVVLLGVALYSEQHVEWNAQWAVYLDIVL